MSKPELDRLLSAANGFDASDLHLVAGVPPAYRVNGEIIIADEDALTEDKISAMVDSLLNEQQKKISSRNGSCASRCCTVSPDACAPRFTGATIIPK